MSEQIKKALELAAVELREKLRNELQQEDANIYGDLRGRPDDAARLLWHIKSQVDGGHIFPTAHALNEVNLALELLD